jgi:hypothetical protein
MMLTECNVERTLLAAAFDVGVVCHGGRRRCRASGRTKVNTNTNTDVNTNTNTDVSRSGQECPLYTTSFAPLRMTRTPETEKAALFRAAFPFRIVISSAN